VLRDGCSNTTTTKKLPISAGYFAMVILTLRRWRDIVPVGSAGRIPRSCTVNRKGMGKKQACPF
jgi:hypothetical protein